MSVFVRMTGGARFVKLTHADTIYAAHYQQPDGNELVIAWTANRPKEIQITGQLQQVVDIVGATVPPSDVRQASRDPLYLVGRNLKISSP